MVFDKVLARDTLYVTLYGEIDQHAAAELRTSFALLLRDPDVVRMEIDCEKVTLMDSSGIGLLLCWYRALSGRTGSIQLHNVQPNVMRVLRISGMHQLFAMMEVDVCTAKTI